MTNPVRFEKDICIIIEHGQDNYLGNEMSSVDYWHQLEPHREFGILPCKKRLPVEPLGEQ